MKKHRADITARFTVKVGEQVLPMSATVPDRQATAVEVLPVIQKLTDDAVGFNIEQTRAQGEEISCRAGCGACCAQPVPVTTLEAQHLANVVMRMPAGKQARVRARFEQIRAAVRAAGLEDSLRELPSMDVDQQRSVAVEYFKLSNSCPFLEDQSCSIYQDRPVECREYLVTSDPKHCAGLDADQINHIDSKIKVLPALTRLSKELGGDQTAGWMIMLFALDWARDGKPSRRRRHAGEWLKKLVGYVVGRDLDQSGHVEAASKGE